MKIILFLLFVISCFTINAQSDTYIDNNGNMRYVEYESPKSYEISPSISPLYNINTKFGCSDLMLLPLDSLYEKTVIRNGQEIKFNTYYLVSFGTPKMILKGRNLSNHGIDVMGYHTVFYLNCRYIPVIIIKGSVDNAKELVMNNEPCYIHICRHPNGYLQHKFVLNNKEYDIVTY